MNRHNTNAGFSVLEVVLAAAVFMLFGVAAVVVIIQAFNSNRLGLEETIASQYASEGIEIARSIKNKSFASLVNSAGTGVVFTGGIWTFSGSTNTIAHNSSDDFIRTITVTDVQRDGSNNIVASGGTVDANTKKITSTVTWNFNSSRPESVALIEYLTNWKNKRGGLLLYGDGGTTTDALKYRIFDATANSWGAATAAFDVDGTTANKAVRIIKMYASKTRNEKIAITRHYNGSAQFIYATVWNGTSWGTPTQLSTWTAATFLDVQNFDGTYLNDGTFMAVYSDNTIIPKYRIWNGTSWATQGSLTTLGTSQIPNYIIAQARPGTNEVMAAFFTQGAAATSANTISEYWSGSAWSAITTHSALSVTNTKRALDWQWSSSTATTGLLVYADSSTDKNVTARVWIANGTGSGAWGTAVNDPTAQTNNLGVMDLQARPGASEFQECNKDALATPTIVCKKITFSGSIPTFVNPTSSSIAAASDTGIERSFDIGFESLSGDPMIAVYSDTTAVPKFKKYTSSTATWDTAATTIATAGFAPGILKAIRVVPQPTGDDILAFFADANFDLYSAVWNGTSNAVYVPPVGNTALETTVDSNAVGQAEAFQQTAVASGSMNSISVYLDSTSLATTVYVGLYADSSGAPGALLGQGNTNAPVNGAWNTISIPTISVTSGTTYWIAILGTVGGVPRFRDRTSGTCAGKTSSQTTLTSLPASWTTGGSFTQCPPSAYGSQAAFNLTVHGINGSAITEHWYDFAWDRF